MLIRNARLLTPAGERRGDCRIEGGRIAALGHELAPADGAPVIDAGGRYLAPGFIDLQCNGGFGRDFTHDPASIWPVAAQLPRFGVTAFLPTIITSPLATVASAQAVVTRPPAGYAGALPLGLHVEGPYLNPQKKGAHDPALMRAPDASEVDDWRPDRGVRLLTLAPELPGAPAAIRRLVAQGVVVSAGHSMATVAEANAGFDAGVRYGTHLFNAMPPLHHRRPGLAAALLDDDRPTIGLIPDGVHVDPTLVRLVWRLAGARLNLVTDAMAAMGHAPGRYRLGGRTVSVDTTSARLADGTLAGSIVTLDQAVRNLMAWTGCTPGDAIATVTARPAALLDLPGKGQLAVGADADLVLLDPDFNVTLTLVGGNIVYRRENA